MGGARLGTTMIAGDSASTDVVDPKSVVREGWNRVSTIYRPPRSRRDAFDHTNADYREWLQPFFRMLVPGSDVLDLGCGCGTPGARLLSERFRVTGVDISDVQIERARALVPAGRFVRADMTAVSFPRGHVRRRRVPLRAHPRPARGAARSPRESIPVARAGGTLPRHHGGDRVDRCRGGVARFEREDVLESRRLAHLREVVRPKGVPSAPSTRSSPRERAGTPSSSYRSPCRLPDSARGRLAPRAK